MVGIPTGGNPSAFFMQSVQGMSMPSNFSMTQRLVPWREVGEARNILVEEAINIGAEFLVFLDEDMVFPANLLQQLLYHLQTKPDWSVVSGLYATKSHPPEPLLYMDGGKGPHYGFKYGEIVGPVLFTGSGATMIRVSDIIDAFDDCPVYDERNPWTGQPMKVRRRFYTGQEDVSTPEGLQKIGWTEDAYFYTHMKDAGRKCFVDTSLICGHWDKDTRTFFYPPNDNGCAVKPDPWTHEPRIVNLGAGGEYSPYELQVDLRDAPGIFRADIRKLPEDWANQFDIARSHHVLEHFGFGETEEVLAEWFKIIKPGGYLEVHVPDMESVAQAIVDGRMDIWVQGAIFGDQGHPFWQQTPYGGYDENQRFLSHSYQHNHHKAGFTAKSLAESLHKAGFGKCEIERDTNLGELRVKAHKEGTNGNPDTDPVQTSE